MSKVNFDRKSVMVAQYEEDVNVVMERERGKAVRDRVTFYESEDGIITDIVTIETEDFLEAYELLFGNKNE